MLALMIALQLNSINVECLKIQPIVNEELLKILKYDGKGIPDITYCKGELK